MTLGTTGAFGFEDFHPPEVIGLYAAAGCTILQVYRNRQRAISPQDILAITRDLPVTIDSIHGHFGDDLDPSSEDEAARRATIALYESEAEYCLALGGDLVVVHPSPAHIPVGDLDGRYAQLRRSFDELARIGEALGVRFAFENMPPYHPVGGDVARLVQAVAAAGSDRIVFLLDTGHAHMTCGIVEGVRAAGGHLQYTHVHDNDGVHDTHNLPGRGTLPWNECAEAMHDVGYTGVFLLEVFEKTSDLRALLTDEWKAMIQGLLRPRAGGRPRA